MTKFITRTIVTTEIQVAEMEVKEGQFIPTQLEPVVVDGKVAEENVLKLAQKKYKGKQIVVTNVIENAKKLKVSYEDFMAIATEVVDGEEVDEDIEHHEPTEMDALIEKHSEQF